MSYTGVEIDQMLEMKVDRAYSGYYDPATKNSLLKDVLVSVVKTLAKQYRQTQQVADELSSLIVWKKPVTINNNRISTQRISIVSIIYAGPTVTVTLDRPHNLIVSDVPIMSGYTGITGIIPSLITAASEFSFSFNNTIAPTGTHTARTGYVDSPKYVSDYWFLLDLKCNFPSSGQFRHIVGFDNIIARGKHYGQATDRFPRSEHASNFLMIEPSTSQCTNVEITYIKRPDKFIDVEDAVYDYGLIYNDSMIKRITDLAAKFWHGYQKDMDGFKIEESLIIENG